MIVGVGSENPVKVGAVKAVVENFLDDAEVIGYEAESGVSEQPMSDEETKNGSIERAKRVIQKSKVDIAIGLEGGVYVEEGQMWNTVWCSAINSKGERVEVNGNRFLLPEKLAKKIFEGNEMGPSMDRLTGKKDVKQKEGMLGIVTGGFVSRTQGYQHLVALALGRLLVEDWK